MNTETHRQLANDIWSICNLLRGPYKRNEYRKVILPLTVLRRFDCLLAPTKTQALETFNQYKGKPESIIRSVMQSATGYPFYSLSKLELAPSQKGRNSLLDDPGNLAPNLNSYINGYSPNIRAIFDHFKFGEQINKMAEKNLLFQVIQKFATFDLSFSGLSADQAAMQMGYVFEELIRIGAEQSNEEAGEHFTPREVIKLMVNLLLTPEQDLRRSHVVKTIYDPACGTGGMLSVAEKYIRDLNSEAKPHLYGQDWNDEAWAVCRSDMLIKGEDADNIALGDTFTKDAHARDEQGQKRSFDYMLANPPFGVEWKQQQRYIEHERDTLGYQGRFGAGTPRINDGALLFLQHMIDKMRPASEGGSRIGIVFNGSPLFTGDAGGGESEIRRWIIENDWLEAVVALPDQLFYNTGISTYIWVLTNHKEAHRKGKVQLIDARNHWVPMEKSLGNKRRRIGDPSDKPKDPDYIGDITGLHGQFQKGACRWVLFDKDGKVVTVTSTAPTGDTPEGQQWKQLVVSKVFDNDDFGYHKITVERPLRLNFHATPERLARLEDETAFKNLATSAKKDEAARLIDIAAGEQRQQQIRDLLAEFAKRHPEQINDRKMFLDRLKPVDRELNVRLSAPELKAVVSALSERDETAAICRNREGVTEPDAELRDNENVPLKESIQAYFEREVLPHVPDAWIDHSKTKIGYEIPLNRHFYRYEPPRELAVIESEIKALEADIVRLLGEVTA
ncbi:class I SAM-dependent DNA methyltransferase [Diaphorobacter sp. C33]|jgi:type I restriction enzyme M protein|uniref:site-specific DNA-methyltransferase (adenine-specific) n=1 Tax=Diaphorobacter nitroreducens TaxID=164759 RepID=A0AAX1WQA3_9BURK|nr:class I SAM-dependent DNA methyltransferase [Diaphorobacter sp. C33]ROR39649.1 type I restriction enzyme M protein [Diaphorobacter nitroreducens]WKK90549.1 class I SAM-dependent DNA methyltransferase [Diaphorobacter sp. C33]HRL52635.1 class I SAM-dependent DNA methyltransferase [Acidovorax temperans]